MKDNKKCEDCVNQHTMDCPNSILCYETQDKPYFKQEEDEEYEPYTDS